METLKWDELKTRRNDHVAKLVNKCIKGHSPQFFKNYFTYNRTVSGRSARQCNELHRPLAERKLPKDLFIIMAVPFLIVTL